MASRELLLTCAIAIAGCDSASPPASVPAHHGKPSARVDLRLDTTALGHGDYDVTLTATPTAATDALELQLDGAKQALGAVAAGETRTMTTRVHVDGDRGTEIFGAAAVGQGNHRRSRATSTWVGTPHPAHEPPVTIYTLPDGSEVAEVRQ